VNEKKPLAGAGTLCPSPILLFYIPPSCNDFRSLEQDLLRAVTGKFCKNLRTEMSGKTAGDFTAWGGETQDRNQTFSANSVKKYSDLFVYSLLIIFYSLLTLFYIILIIVYCLFIFFL